MIKVKGNTVKEKMSFMLEYVKNHYSEKNLAFVDGRYKYLTDNGKKCAIGLFLPHEEKYFQYGRTVDCLFEEYEELKKHPNFKGIPMEFLESLQNLHDCAANWDKNGLNDIGHREYCWIKDKWLTTKGLYNLFFYR